MLTHSPRLKVFEAGVVKSPLTHIKLNKVKI